LELKVKQFLIYLENQKKELLFDRFKIKKIYAENVVEENHNYIKHYKRDTSYKNFTVKKIKKKTQVMYEIKSI
jgi:hypothetical protein